MTDGGASSGPSGSRFRRIVLIVALANLAYFGVEFAIGLSIQSASLFADSVDFLEDAAVNILIAVAIGWSARRRARTGMALAGILLAPALAFLWVLWNKFSAPQTPEPFMLGAAGLGALVVNVACAFLLAPWKRSEGSLSRAAYLSARNDALANIAIMAAGVVTLVYPSIWPDVVVGVAIAAMNVDAAHEVWEAARAEGDASTPPRA